MKTFLQYLREVHEADLEAHALEDKIDAAEEGDFSDYAFNHIFGNKLRLIIPLGKKGTIPLSEDQVREALKKEGYSVDFEKGTAVKTVETKQGPKTQVGKLGKVLKKLSKQDAFWQQVAHWWEMKADPTKKMGDATGVSIVISRSPMDLIRMSDHPQWGSCHAPPGKSGHLSSYWPCAGQEARSGGAIAYVVKNSDLKTVDNLQAPEIFKDPDRNVKGVEPLERLRLRRFTVYDHKDQDQLDILVPEDSTYGIRHVDFRESVEEWAKKVQKPFIDFDNPPDWDSAELRGGTYQDTNAATLWNHFFGTKVYGSKESEDRGEQEEHGGVSADSMHDQAEEQLNARNFKHVSVWFDVEDYEEPQLYYSGSVCFDFNKQDFIHIPTEEDVSIPWRYGKDKDIPETLGDKIKEAMDITLAGNGNDDIRLDVSGNTVQFCLDLNTEDDGYADNQNDRFENFLDWVDRDIEQDYDEHWGALRDLLVKEGWMKEGWEWEKLKHFDLEVDDRKFRYTAWITSQEMWIGDLRGVDKKNIETSGGRLEFPNHTAISTNAATIFPQFKFLKPDNIRLTTDHSLYGLQDGPITTPYKVILKLNIAFPPSQYRMYYAAVKHIDDNWDAYNKRASKWWEMVKPMLMDQQGGAFANRKQLPTIPKRIKSTEKQLQFPFMQQGEFKDWVIFSELPHLHAN